MAGTSPDRIKPVKVVVRKDPETGREIFVEAEAFRRGMKLTELHRFTGSGTGNDVYLLPEGFT